MPSPLPSQPSASLVYEKRYAWIDGLRGLAALAVVVGRVASIDPLGAAVVMVFSHKWLLHQRCAGFCFGRWNRVPRVHALVRPSDLSAVHSGGFVSRRHPNFAGSACVSRHYGQL